MLHFLQQRTYDKDWLICYTNAIRSNFFEVCLPIRTFRHQNPSPVLSVTCLTLTYLTRYYFQQPGCLSHFMKFKHKPEQSHSRHSAVWSSFACVLFCLMLHLHSTSHPTTPHVLFPAKFLYHVRKNLLYERRLEGKGKGKVHPRAGHEDPKGE